MEAGSIVAAYAAARSAAADPAAGSGGGTAWRPQRARALRHAAQLFRALEYLHGRAPPMVRDGGGRRQTLMQPGDWTRRAEMHRKMMRQIEHL